MNERVREPVAVSLGLLFVVGGAFAWMVGAGVEAMTPGWVPIFRELSMPIAVAEILFGLGLVYTRTQQVSGALLAFLVFATWALTLYSVLTPEGAVTVSKGEIPAEIGDWKLSTHGQWQDGASPPQLEFPANSPGAMRIRIASTTPEHQPWHIQLNRNGVSVLKDREYVLRFRARAGGVRPINAGVARAYGDYGSLGLYREVTVTEDWQQLGFAFNPTDSDTNARIFFDLGQDAHDVELGSVALVQQAPGAPPPLATVWQLSLNGPVTDRSSLARLEFPIAPSQSLRVRIFKTTPERQPWHIQLNRPGVVVVKDQEYVLRFRARASANRPINVAVGRAYGDYRSLGLYREVAVTENWQPFEFVFNPTDGDANARIFFDLGEDGHGVELSDVTVTRSDEITPAPKEGQSVSANPNGSTGELIDEGRTGTASRITVSRWTPWLQIFSKPLWILILLWCSGWLRFPRRIQY